MSRTSDFRASLALALGGQPGPYVVATVVAGLLIFPLRLPFQRDDPLPYVVAYTGLWVVSVTAFIPLMDHFLRWTGHSKAPVAEPPVPRSTWRRRGALVALGVGVPYYGGLLAFSLIAGPYWIFAALYLLVLAVVAALAIRNLRRAAAPSEQQRS